MKRVIIKLALFTANQHLFIEQDGKLEEQDIPTDSVAKFIAESGCDEVLIYGVPMYAKKWEREVNTKFDKKGMVWKYNNREFLDLVKKRAGGNIRGK